MDGLSDMARFRGVSPRMSKEIVDLVCRSYFLKKPDEEA
jgi:hypothetical protein